MYDPVPSEASVAVKMQVCPWSSILGETDSNDGTNAGFTVTETVEDSTEFAP